MKISILILFLILSNACSSDSDNNGIIELTNLTDKRSANSQNPAWSPDTNEILFTGVTGSSSYGLFKIQVSDNSIISLTDDLDHDYVNLPGSTWCEKYDRLVISSDRGGHDDLWTLDSDGTNWQQVTNDSDRDYEPSWSDDCEWIVFQSLRNENWDIYKIRKDGSDITRLTSDLNDDWEPNWSPDGKLIVFQSKTLDGWRLYTMTPDGDNITALSPVEVESTDPSWTPDSKSVVYSSDSNDSNSEDIFIIDIDTLKTRNLTNHKGYEGAPSISPDGKILAFEADWTGVLDIWIVGFVEE